MEHLIANVDGYDFLVEQILDHQLSSFVLPFEGMDKSFEQTCKKFNNGRCPRGNLCPFRHIVGEKTVVCKHWLRGLCKKGDDCEFLHLYDTEKMPECFFYANYGECHNDECPFLHIDPESKIKDCPWYARGFCNAGPNCAHRHRKLVMCVNYLCGFCPLGSDCPAAHPSFEIPEDPDLQRAPAYGMRSRESQHNLRRLTAQTGQIVCHRCGTPGHKTPQCPQLKGDNGQPRACFKCGQTGHFAKECPNPQNNNNNQGMYPPRGPPRFRPPPPQFNDRGAQNHGNWRPPQQQYQDNNHGQDNQQQYRQFHPTQ